MKKTVYQHIGIHNPSCLADGAYCVAGSNGNVFIHFFQEQPNLPSEIKDSITQQKNNRHFAISTWISITCIIISLFSAYFTFKGYEVAKQQGQSSEQPDRQQ